MTRRREGREGSDFSADKRRTLAARAGHACSNPGCNRGTSAPHSDAKKSVSRGKACHITAAAPGGPRYDESLSSDERSSINNGIWLCDACADLVDKDTSLFSIARLHAWRHAAEQRALDDGGARRGPSEERDRVLIELPIERDRFDAKLVARLLSDVEELTGFDTGRVLVISIRRGSTLVTVSLPFGGGEFLEQKTKAGATFAGLVAKRARLLAPVERTRQGPQRQLMELSELAGALDQEEEIEGWDLVSAVQVELTTRIRGGVEQGVLNYLEKHGHALDREIAEALQTNRMRVNRARRTIRHVAQEVLRDLGFSSLIPD